MLTNIAMKDQLALFNPMVLLPFYSLITVFQPVLL